MMIVGFKPSVVVLLGVLCATQLLGACALSPAKGVIVSAEPDPSPQLDHNAEIADMLNAQQAQLGQQQQQIDAIAKDQQTLLAEIEDLSQQTKNMIDALNLPLDTDPPQPSSTEAGSPLAPTNKTIIGRNEWVYLPMLNQNLRARVDTGARTSSINASDVTLFERDGKKWVRFKIPNDEKNRTFERPLARYSRILQASEEKREKRYVVKLKIALGEHMQETEVTLADREKMLFPVLLGRRYINDLFLVDPSLKSTQKKHNIGPASP